MEKIGEKSWQMQFSLRYIFNRSLDLTTPSCANQCTLNQNPGFLYTDGKMKKRKKVQNMGPIR